MDGEICSQDASCDVFSNPGCFYVIEIDQNVALWLSQHLECLMTMMLL